VQGLGRASDKQRGRRIQFQATAAGRRPKTALPQEISRPIVEVGIPQFRKGGGITLELLGDLIAQGEERRARTRIIGDALPLQIAVQFWQDGRQILARCSRSAGESARMAFPISATVLI
jgi:hypothetical protein